MMFMFLICLFIIFVIDEACTETLDHFKLFLSFFLSGFASTEIFVHSNPLLEVWYVNTFLGLQTIFFFLLESK